MNIITKKMPLLLGPLVLRNRIINGDMRINQRGATSITSTASYFLDRWYLSASGSNLTLGQTSGSLGFQYGLLVGGNTSNTGFILGQKIESTNIYDLVNGTVTLSAYISSTILTSVTWTAYTPTVTDNYTAKNAIASGTFSINSTLSQYSASFNIPNSAQTGLSIEFSFGALTTGSVLVTGVQLESGNTVSIFERLPIGLQLQLCQRYYYQIGGVTNTISLLSYGTTGSPTGALLISFPATMRATPTYALVGSMTYSNCSGLTTSGISTTGATIYVLCTSTGLIAAQNTSGTLVTFTAEL